MAYVGIHNKYPDCVTNTEENLYSNGKVSVCLSVHVCVTNFKSNPYLSCFNSEFEAVKGKLGLPIEYIKISLPPTSVCPPLKCLSPNFAISGVSSRISIL